MAKASRIAARDGRNMASGTQNMTREGSNMAKPSGIAARDAEYAQNMAPVKGSITSRLPNMVEYGGNALSLVSLDVGLHGLAVARFGRSSHNHPWELVVAWYIPVADAITAADTRRPSHISASSEAIPLGKRHKRGPEIWRALAKAIPAEACADLLVMETMVVYEGSTVDPADLLELQGICGACATALPWGRVERVEARTWSEGVPKDVRHARLDRALVDRGWSERILPVPARRLNDVLDAVGIGLWWTGGTSTRRWSASLRP
jgi:hypothetical protein